MTHIQDARHVRGLLPPVVVGAVGAAEYPVHREVSATRTLRFVGTGEHTLDVRVRSGAIRILGDNGRTCASKRPRRFRPRPTRPRVTPNATWRSISRTARLP